MQGQLRGEAYRTTVVCVDAYENQVLTGRLYNPACGSEAFQSLMEFLLKMENLLSGMRIPQSFTTARSFAALAPEPVEGTPPGNEARTGKCGTFAVRVLFRQNASWQGSVTWLEGGREERFRSVLELALLMDSALSGKERNRPRQTSA